MSSTAADFSTVGGRLSSPLTKSGTVYPTSICIAVLDRLLPTTEGNFYQSDHSAIFIFNGDTGRRSCLYILGSSTDIIDVAQFRSFFDD
jgi:hypothetical protein